MRLKQRTEHLHRLLHPFAKLVEGEEYMVAGEGFSDTELYVRHEAQVWIGLKLRLGVDDHAYYLAVFERLAGPDRLGLGRFWPVGVNQRGGGGARHRDGDDRPVLVDVVEITEGVESVMQVPSVVRLYRVEGLSDVFGHPPADLGELTSSPSPRRSGQDREARAVGGLVAAHAHELVGEVVERRAEVVQAVPDDGAPGRIEDRRVLRPVDVAASVGVHFDGGRAYAHWKRLPKCALQLGLVTLRPVQLDLDAVQAGQLPPPLPCHALTSPEMADDQNESEPTQLTQPKDGKPVEIPVPKLSTIRAAIRKLAQPSK